MNDTTMPELSKLQSRVGNAMWREQDAANAFVWGLVAYVPLALLLGVLAALFRSSALLVAAVALVAWTALKGAVWLRAKQTLTYWRRERDRHCRVHVQIRKATVTEDRSSVSRPPAA